MEDIRSGDSLGGSSDPEGPIKEANSTTDKGEDNLIYDWEHFRVDKARHSYRS